MEAQKQTPLKIKISFMNLTQWTFFYVQLQTSTCLVKSAQNASVNLLGFKKPSFISGGINNELKGEARVLIQMVTSTVNQVLSKPS